MGCHQSRMDRLSGENESERVKMINEKQVNIETLKEGRIDLSCFALMPVLTSTRNGLIRVAQMVGRDTSSRSPMNTNPVYAIKSASKSFILKEEFGPDEVMSELKILALLQHKSPFICNCHYAFQDLGHIYFVLDLAIGGSLAHYLQKQDVVGRVTEYQCKFIICQVLLALEACHSEGVLHRGIRPRSIMLNEKGYVKVTGFSHSQLLPDTEECIVRHGTNEYSAPEVYLAPHAPHGKASDMFSVGIVVHEIVTGNHPFHPAMFKDLLSAASPKHAGSLERLYPIDLSHLWGISKEEASLTCKDFIRELLRISPNCRLGAFEGLRQIRHHNWLHNVDWIGLYAQTTPSPLSVDTSPKFSLFHEGFKALNERVISSSISHKDQDKFIGFGLNDNFYDRKMNESTNCLAPTVHFSNGVPSWRDVDGLKWTHTCHIKSAFKERPLTVHDPSFIESTPRQVPHSLNVASLLWPSSHRPALHIDVSDKFDDLEYSKIRMAAPKRPSSGQKNFSPFFSFVTKDGEGEGLSQPQSPLDLGSSVSVVSGESDESQEAVMKKVGKIHAPSEIENQSPVSDILSEEIKQNQETNIFEEDNQQLSEPEVDEEEDGDLLDAEIAKQLAAAQILDLDSIRAHKYLQHDHHYAHDASPLP